jgi:hypothetical protein
MIKSKVLSLYKRRIIVRLLNKTTVSAATSVATAVSLVSAMPVRAQVSSGIGATESAASTADGDLSTIINNTINILLFIVGAAAVIMLIIGGIRYILSSGDQTAVAAAKNTILYAIIGVIVAMLAYAIVNFVFTTVSG